MRCDRLGFGRSRSPHWSSATSGRADILVNNAGIGSFPGPLHQMPPDSWEQVMNTNLRGVYYCIRSFAPMMIRARSGHIVNISSLAGKNALPNGAAYAASKWGLNGLSYSVAEELREPQHPRLRGLSRIGAHRAEPARRQRSEKDAAAERCGSCGGDAGDAGAAIVRQRSAAAPDVETVACSSPMFPVALTS